MQLHEEIDVALPPATVWEALADVQLVASCIPGAELAPPADDAPASSDSDGDDYKGWLTVRFGPKAIKFTGEVHHARDEAERVATITGRGQDPRSKTRVRTTLTVSVVAGSAADRAGLVVHGDTDIAGPLASLIEAGAEQVARQLVDQFASNLRARLEEAPAPAAPESEPVTDGGGASAPTPATTSAQAPSPAPAPAQSVNVMSGKMFFSIVWATLRRWLHIGRR